MTGRRSNYPVSFNADTLLVHKHRLLLISLVVCTLVFTICPELDIYFSSIFFDETSGSFSLSQYPELRFVRLFMFYSTPVAVLLLLAGLLLHRFALLSWLPGLQQRDVVFLLGTLALGPGLVVNGILKEFWGRARPRNIEYFDGEQPFSMAFQIVDYCASNCSFTSGESATAFWLFGFVVLLPATYRSMGVLILAPIVGFSGLLRVAFGGHYLSDVLFSWIIVAATMVLVGHFVYHHNLKRYP